jgi:hypothetical protein
MIPIQGKSESPIITTSEPSNITKLSPDSYSTPEKPESCHENSSTITPAAMYSCSAIGAQTSSEISIDAKDTKTITRRLQYHGSSSQPNLYHGRINEFHTNDNDSVNVISSNLYTSTYAGSCGTRALYEHEHTSILPGTNPNLEQRVYSASNDQNLEQQDGLAPESSREQHGLSCAHFPQIAEQQGLYQQLLRSCYCPNQAHSLAYTAPDHVCPQPCEATHRAFLDMQAARAQSAYQDCARTFQREDGNNGFAIDAQASSVNAAHGVDHESGGRTALPLFAQQHTTDVAQATHMQDTKSCYPYIIQQAMVYPDGQNTEDEQIPTTMTVYLRIVQEARSCHSTSADAAMHDQSDGRQGSFTDPVSHFYAMDARATCVEDARTLLQPMMMNFCGISRSDFPQPPRDLYRNSLQHARQAQANGHNHSTVRAAISPRDSTTPFVDSHNGCFESHASRTYTNRESSRQSAQQRHQFVIATLQSLLNSVKIKASLRCIKTMGIDAHKYTGATCTNSPAETACKHLRAFANSETNLHNTNTGGHNLKTSSCSTSLTDLDACKSDTSTIPVVSVRTTNLFVIPSKIPGADPVTFTFLFKALGDMEWVMDLGCCTGDVANGEGFFMFGVRGGKTESAYESGEGEFVRVIRHLGLDGIR